jgi:signal transduction histidine kinase
VHALRDLCGRIEQTFKVRVTIRAREAGAAIDGFSADHLYRIAQESITNAVKHGRANRILVTVETGPAQVLLSVSSNGARLNGSPYSDGLGIRSMRYRARLLGATFSITARPAGGACVLCRMPTNAAVVAVLPAAS